MEAARERAGPAIEVICPEPEPQQTKLWKRNFRLGLRLGRDGTRIPYWFGDFV